MIEVEFKHLFRVRDLLHLQLEVSRKQRKPPFICAIAEPRVQVISRPLKIEIAKKKFFSFEAICSLVIRGHFESERVVV